MEADAYQGSAIRATAAITIGAGSLTTAGQAAADQPGMPRTSVILSSIGIHADTGTISLGFSAALVAEDAGNPEHYRVEVESATGTRREVHVESAAYDSSKHLVILALPEGSLQGGDRVVVSWSQLHDGQGLTVEGDAGPFTVR